MGSYENNDELRNRGQKVKLLVCDMDGTLLNAQKEVSARTMEALKEMRRQGKSYTICTGRITPMVMYYIDKLGIDAPVITANGAVIWGPKEKKVLHSVAVDEEDAFRLLSFCKSRRLDYSALTMEKSYFSENSVRKSRFDQYNEIAAKNGGVRMELEYFDKDHSCIKGQQIFKILIYELIPGQLREVEAFLTGFQETGCTSSEPGLLDVSHRSVDKGYGVRKAAEIMGLKKEEICTAGDYFNDIPMLKQAGFPVAMENGCDEIKEYACYVTGTNEEDGIADMLYQFVL